MTDQKDVTVEELLAKAKKPSADAMKLHPFYRGKVETALKCCVRSFDDFAIWYTPGVASPCRAIHEDLEDFSYPKCFGILDRLRNEMSIPVFHDDVQGTGTVELAGLINALKVVGKKMDEVSIAFIGSGASNVACSRLIFGWGADPAKCFMVDSKGILGKHRKDLEMRKAEYVDKWRLCQATNAEGREGGIPDAIKGADVVIALSRSGPGVIQPEWISTMAKDSVLFACANPVPEIWPWEAKEAGAAVVATCRSDFDNRVNNPWASRVSSAARWTCAPVPSPMRCASRPLRPWPTTSATSSATP